MRAVCDRRNSKEIADLTDRPGEGVNLQQIVKERDPADGPGGTSRKNGPSIYRAG